MAKLAGIGYTEGMVLIENDVVEFFGIPFFKFLPVFVSFFLALFYHVLYCTSVRNWWRFEFERSRQGMDCLIL